MAKKICCLVVALHLFFVPLYASENNPLSKLARGIANISLGWLEVPRQMIKVKEEKGGASGEVAGIFWGAMKGFVCFTGRTAVGAYEAATFLIPSYKPLVKPEYIFSDQEEQEEKE